MACRHGEPFLCRVCDHFEAEAQVSAPRPERSDGIERVTINTGVGLVVYEVCHVCDLRHMSLNHMAGCNIVNGVSYYYCRHNKVVRI